MALNGSIGWGNCGIAFEWLELGNQSGFWFWDMVWGHLVILECYWMRVLWNEIYVLWCNIDYKSVVCLHVKALGGLILLWNSCLFPCVNRFILCFDVGMQGDMKMM